MPLVIKQDAGHFEPAPPGLHRAVCVDVVDKGIDERGQYGPKAKLMLVFQIEARNSKKERFQVRGTYTQSMYKESNLRKALESWRGKEFRDEETVNFDVEKLLGKNCQLAVTHGTSQSTGRTFAKITAVLPPTQGQALKAEDYAREPWATKPKPQDEPITVEPLPEDDFTDDGSGVPF